MKCAHCQTEMPTGDRFCQHCGKEQPAMASASPPPSVRKSSGFGGIIVLVLLVGAAVVVSRQWLQERLPSAEPVASPPADVRPGTLTQTATIDGPAIEELRQRFAGTYRAVSESEWALEVTLAADGRATFKHESWAAGGYDQRKTNLVEGTWEIATADRLQLRHGTTTEIVQFRDALSFSEFGREGASAGFKGIADAAAPPALIGRSALWRAEALDTLFNPAAEPPAPPPSVPLTARIFASESVFLGRLGGYLTDVGANSVNEQDHLAFAAGRTNIQLIQNLAFKYQAQFDLQAAKGLAAAQSFYADASARLASYGIDLGDSGSNLSERRAHLDWAQRQTPQKMREAIAEKVTVLLTGAFSRGGKF